MCMFVCMYKYVEYICIYIYREREREKDRSLFLARSRSVSTHSLSLFGARTFSLHLSLVRTRTRARSRLCYDDTLARSLSLACETRTRALLMIQVLSRATRSLSRAIRERMIITHLAREPAWYHSERTRTIIERTRTIIELVSHERTRTIIELVSHERTPTMIELVCRDRERDEFCLSHDQTRDELYHCTSVSS